MSAVSGPEAWVERVRSLDQWRRDGERAPHQPLLLLYALGRLQRTGASAMRFSDLEADLRRLLEEFGPPRPTSPGYPFHHLASYGLWVTHGPAGGASPGPSLGVLRAGAVGELAGDFAAALAGDPAVFSAVVRALLDANFPPSLHQDILDAVGITLAPAELGLAAPTGKGLKRRDLAFRGMVLSTYEYRCAVCGFDGSLSREAVGLDAAHVRWWAASGPDEICNGPSLCALHHKLFDRGAIGLNPSGNLEVSSHFIARSAIAEAFVLSLVGKPLLRPQVAEDAGVVMAFRDAAGHIWYRDELGALTDLSYYPAPLRGSTLPGSTRLRPTPPPPRTDTPQTSSSPTITNVADLDDPSMPGEGSL